MLAPDVTFTALATNQLQMSWNTVEGAISYTIQYRMSETESWQTLDTVDMTYYTHSGIGYNTIYYYRISANSETDIVWSNPCSARIYYLNSCSVSKTATAMTISWNLMSGVDAYIVQRSSDNSTWETLADDVTVNNYVDSTFEQNQWYYYRVAPNTATGFARQANGMYGVWKQIELTATPVGSAAIRIECPPPEGYSNNRILQYATSPTGTWSNLATLYSNTSTYTHSNLTPGAAYYYRAYCYDGNYTDLYTVTEGITLPNAIENFCAIRAGDSVLLSWDEIDESVEYTISKSTDQIEWTDFTETDTVFCDDSPIEGATNYYRISATFDGQEYAASSEILIIGEPETFTAAPQSNGNVALSWSSCVGANYYNLQRRETDSSEWTAIASNINRLYYNDYLGFEQCCDYRISPVGGKWKQVDAIWIPNISGLQPTATALSDGSIRLDWAGIPNATEFDISRQRSNGNYEQIATANGTHYIDTDVQPNTTYYYRIGFNALNFWCSTISATTLIPEAGPAVLDFDAPTNTQLNISWETVEGAESYSLQYRTSEADAWTTLVTTSETIYSHIGLSVNRDLFYRRSVNTDTNVEWSRQHRVRIYQTTSLTANVTVDSITLNWYAVNGVSQFMIDRSCDSETWTTLTTEATGTTFTDSSINHNVNYIYRVRPYLPGGASYERSVVGYYQIETLTAALGQGRSVQITFPNRTAFTGNRILYRTAGPIWANPTQITSTNLTDPEITLTDSTVQPGQTYYYWLACGNAEPVRSNPILTPNAINSFTIVCMADRICLSWDAVENATEYVLYRSVDKENWTTYTSTNASYIDREFESGTIYWYRIETSVDDIHYRSDLLSAIVLSAPETFTATRSTSGGWGTSGAALFILQWSACNGAASYEIQYRTEDSNVWITRDSNITYTNTTIIITHNVWYYFRIRPSGGPVWKESGPVWYPNPTELYPEIAVNEDGYLEISWTPIASAKGYVITRSTSTYNTFEPIGQTETTSFIDRSAMPNTRYYYKIGFPNDDLWTTYATEISGNYPAPPTDILLSNVNISPVAPIGTVIGILSTETLTTGLTITYELVDGEGDADNALFAIEDNQLVVAATLTERTCSVRVRSTDSNGLYIEKIFDITVSMPTLESPFLYLKSVGYSDVSLYWQNIITATSYQLEYRKESESQWQAVTLTSWYYYNRPYSLSGLEPDTSYLFRIKAIAEGFHDSPYSESTAITLVDYNPPVITITPNRTIYVTPGEPLVLPTATAYDSVDGSLPVTYIILDENDEEILDFNTNVHRYGTVIWTAVDSSGNTATYSLEIIVSDAVPPVITLNEYGDTGLHYAILEPGEEYVEYGAAAVDAYDGPVEITISGEVNSGTSGVYYVVYSASDLSGNTAAAARTVLVSSEEAPVITDWTATRLTRAIQLNWTLSPDVPVTVQRRIYGSSEWIDLVTGITAGSWSDDTISENTRCDYRLVSETDDMLSSIISTYLSDTISPEIVLHKNTTTNTIDFAIPYGDEYFEYGADVSDIVDPSPALEITDNIDFETPGLYLVQYCSRDEAGHETIAFRNVFIKDDDYIAIPDFKASAISQFTIRLTWATIEHLGVSIQRRQAESSEWIILAENVFDSVYDDTTVEPFVDYFYRLVFQDGTVLTAEDTAWTIRTVHYSTVIQPVSISAIETTTKQKWSVVTQFARTWTSLTEINV